MSISVKEAQERRVCRICLVPISTEGCPRGFEKEFGKRVFPDKVTFNFGKEYAHTKCLESEKK